MGGARKTVDEEEDSSSSSGQSFFWLCATNVKPFTREPPGETVLIMLILLKITLILATTKAMSVYDYDPENDRSTVLSQVR